MKDKHQRYKDDLAEAVFGRLTAKYVSKIDIKKRAYWLCQCICGRTKEVRRDQLLTGNTKSCGCLNEEAIRKVAGPLKNVATKRVYNKYKQSALHRGIEFLLSIQELEEIITKSCIYCGAPPENVITRFRINDEFLYNGIDRVDNNLGYTKDNCVPCCWECNQSKHSRTKQEFLDWIERVYKFNHNKIER